MRRGQRGADRFRRSISCALTKQPCWSFVGRLLDTFDNDANGVSGLQHFLKRRWLPSGCASLPRWRMSSVPHAAPALPRVTNQEVRGLIRASLLAAGAQREME